MRFDVHSVRSRRLPAGVCLLCVPCFCAGVSLGGCSSIRPSYDSPEPAARNAAIVETARTMNASDVPRVVDMLASDDPATRVLAIRTLERLTGQTLGYLPEADRWEREEALARWRAAIADGALGAVTGDVQGAGNAATRGKDIGESDGRASR